MSSPHRQLEDRDRRSFLRRGLDALPDKLREAVILRDLQGLSYQEMADRLHLPEGTVKSRINLGREELSRLLLRAQQSQRAGRSTGRVGAGAASVSAGSPRSSRIACHFLRASSSCMLRPSLSDTVPIIQHCIVSTSPDGQRPSGRIR